MENRKKDVNGEKAINGTLQRLKARSNMANLEKGTAPRGLVLHWGNFSNGQTDRTR